MIKPYKKGKWITKYDEELNITDMETSHIKNTISYLKKHSDFYDECGGTWYNPDTFYYEDNKELVDNKIEELEDELKRRGNK